MSAFGPKQTWASAPHMSAFGGFSGHAVLRCICLLLTQADMRAVVRPPRGAATTDRHSGPSRGCDL